MKTLNLFLGILFLFAIFSLNVKAENFYASCDDNPDCEWMDQPSFQIDCGGCMYIVEYQTRVCEGGNYSGMGHYKINRIEPVDPYCQSPCNNEGNTELLEKAGSEIIWHMAMTDGSDAWLPPEGPNECILELQGFMAACWMKDGSSPGGGWWLEPCDLQSCCRYVWYFCRDGDGELMDPQIQAIQSLVPCGTAFPECFTICGYE